MRKQLADSTRLAPPFTAPTELGAFSTAGVSGAATAGASKMPTIRNGSLLLSPGSSKNLGHQDSQAQTLPTISSQRPMQSRTELGNKGECTLNSEPMRPRTAPTVTQLMGDEQHAPCSKHCLSSTEDQNEHRRLLLLQLDQHLLLLLKLQ